MDTNLVIPMGIDKIKVIFDFYFTDISAEKQKQNAESSLSETGSRWKISTSARRYSVG